MSLNLFHASSLSTHATAMRVCTVPQGSCWAGGATMRYHGHIQPVPLHGRRPKPSTCLKHVKQVGIACVGNSRAYCSHSRCAPSQKHSVVLLSSISAPKPISVQASWVCKHGKTKDAEGTILYDRY
ncbi:hypothetical protein EJ03DRAFT_6473 [Teratosphaeria nubilosa]|uniref:Uncharacterized protein n=1 Tax=Teratosphaeria nubilosa TaxID=161662 RepID=A0A6G1LN95_9PEZI|nr:hypothetical protein EJ03DRAFT_6473 [Teratosphaeria nubilosa]